MRCTRSPFSGVAQCCAFCAGPVNADVITLNQSIHMKLRYGIRSLLVVCAVVAAFFPFQHLYDHWFRSSYSGYHIHTVLGDRVANGDSFDYVSSLFDRSEARTEDWIVKNRQVFANGKPVLANLKEGDKYYVFYINGGNVRALFQFRGGSVVNHTNSIYQGPYSTVQHYRDQSPSSLFRHGALPVYTLCASALGVAIWLAWHVSQRKQRSA